MGAGLRRRGWLSVGLIALVAATVAVTPGAGAQPWRRIASGGMDISDQVGLARFGDLHVAWRRRGAGSESLLQAPISSYGAVGAPVTIVSGWASVGSPALVAWGPEMRVFWPGTATLTTGDPTYGLDMAETHDAGASWSVSPTAIAGGQSAFSSIPAAVVAEGGMTFVQAWAGPDSTVVHVGLDPSVPPVGGYGMGYDQALAVSAGSTRGPHNEVMVASCTELGASTGVFVARVDPFTSNGTRVGDVLRLPDSGRCPASTRVALAGFPLSAVDTPDGWPYFFVAASSVDGRRVRVYDIAHSKIVAVHTVASGPSFKQQIAIATADGGGYVWVGWKDSHTGNLVFRRSNRRPPFLYGAPVTVALPRGQTIYQLALNAQVNRLDAVATMSDANNVVSLFATQVLPGLTLEAGTRKHIANKGFRVLDAGDPVMNATVTVDHRRLTTNGNGYAKTYLPTGSYKVTASKPGYHTTSVRIRIR
jgi:Carboxypeptidase regulatory-like domain